jgi:hypothetical protein
MVAVSRSQDAERVGYWWPRIGAWENYTGPNPSLVTWDVEQGAARVYRRAVIPTVAPKELPTKI